MRMSLAMISVDVCFTPYINLQIHNCNDSVRMVGCPSITHLIVGAAGSFRMRRRLGPVCFLIEAIARRAAASSSSSGMKESPGLYPTTRPVHAETPAAGRECFIRARSRRREIWIDILPEPRPMTGLLINGCGADGSN